MGRTKNVKLFLAAALLTLSMGTTVYAGTWQAQEDGQWKYQNDDGSFATGWVEDGKKSYYLDAGGIMLANTTTPDGKQVGPDGAWDGQPAKAMLSMITSVPTTVIGPGTYKVGTDIAAGEYVLFCTDSYIAFYEIASDASGSIESMIANDNFDYNSIISVNDGEYLKLSGCSLSPISEVPQIDYRMGDMFKVGYHLPAGEYKLLSTSDYSSYYAILENPNALTEDIVTNDIFDGQAYVTVSDGQYLQLRRCTIFTAAQ